MKRVKRIIAVICGLAVFAIGSRGQDYRTDINPALRYYQAFILEPTLSASNQDVLFNTEWRGQKMSDAVGDLISGFQNSLSAFRLAARATAPCDWGIDPSPGPDTTMPHLSRCKRLARTANLRVHWELQHNLEDEAANDLAAIFALGRNTARDQTLIGLLVDYSIETLAIDTIAENFYSFAPSTLQKLSDAFDNAPSNITVADAMRTGEKALFHDWLQQRLIEFQKESPNDDAAVMSKLRDLSKSMIDQTGTNLWLATINNAGNSAELMKALQQQDFVYDKAAEVLSLPHPAFEPQAAKFEADIKKSGNYLVAMSLPAIMKAKAKEFRMQITLAMFHAAVAYKVHGPDAFKAVNDPTSNQPFQFDKFVFNGVDRGFKLSSGYDGNGYPETMIFVETDGPAFFCEGKNAGEPLSK